VDAVVKPRPALAKLLIREGDRTVGIELAEAKHVVRSFLSWIVDERTDGFSPH